MKKPFQLSLSIPPRESVRRYRWVDRSTEPPAKPAYGPQVHIELLQKHISATSSNSSNDECAPSKRWYAQILPSQKHDNLHCFRPCLPRSFMTYNTTLFAAARRQYLVEHQKH